MKALYFDCSSGISGNMTLGALLELIEDKGYLVNELKKLNVDGYEIEISQKIKNGITGTYVDVILEHEHHHDHEHEHEHSHEHHHDHEHEHSHEHHHDHEHEHSHEHHHDHEHEHSHEHHHEHEHEHNHEHHHHEHRNLFDVNRIIDESTLSNEVKDLAKRIFLRVAKAESKVHHKSLEEVHFHEVGAIDSIVDIIGTAILIDKIKPDVIYSSIVNDGYGFIECAHGTISVPVPATSEIIANSDAILRQIDIDTELVTPTGAAIIAELSSSFGNMPAMNVKKIGWGCGFKELKIPNVLKVSLGEISDQDDEIIVMETNIDDCSSEMLAYTMTKLFENGALDAFFTPIYMKKNRPAYRMSVVCHPQDVEVLSGILFKETTTIGIRYRKEQRIVLPRKQIEVTTSLGNIKAKQVTFEDQTWIYPEYESVKEIALKNNCSIKEVYSIFNSNI